MPLRRSLLALVLLALLPASAHAVVGGTNVAPSKVPWFVATGICGGTLIAPDRIATAAHCFDPVDYSDIERIRVGGETRRGIRVALPSTWRQRRAGFALDDIAIVQLDRPVTSVTPVPLAEPGAKAPSRVVIIGRGQTKAPRPGQTAEPGVFPPHWASLKSLADADCERRWKRSATKYSNRFVAASALCAVDADGRAPFSSVCNGDSGGPMVSGTLARPLLVGVISWTGPRCGADKLPSVSAEVAHFHSFLTDTDPVWAPVPGGPAKVTGDPRVGATLRCEIPAWEVVPDKLEIRWLRRVRTKAGYEFRNVGSAETYKAVPADSGNLIDCQARGSNAGGEAETPPAASAVRIAGQAGAEAGAAVSRATSAA